MRKPKAPKHCYWNGPHLWGRQTIHGKKRRWSLRTDDVEVAKARVKADRAKALAAAHYGDRRTTYEDAVIGWADSYVKDRGLGENTVTRYAVSLKQMEPQLRGLYVDEVDIDVVDKIVTARRAEGITDATLRRDLGALGSVLAFAKSKRWRPDNPAMERMGEIKERRDPIVLPEIAHIERVIQRAPGLIQAIIPAARLTGCRLEELVGALRTNLDHARREMTVIGKGNKLRVVSLDYGDAYELLRALPAHVGSKWLFWHGAGEPYRNLSSRFSFLVRGVFAAAYEETHGPSKWNKTLWRDRLAAQDDPDWIDIGFRTFTFHHLRHLHAVEWLRAGEGLYELQQRLGHESITTTEGYLKFLTADEVLAAKQPGGRRAIAKGR